MKAGRPRGRPVFCVAAVDGRVPIMRHHRVATGAAAWRQTLSGWLGVCQRASFDAPMSICPSNRSRDRAKALFFSNVPSVLCSDVRSIARRWRGVRRFFDPPIACNLFVAIDHRDVLCSVDEQREFPDPEFPCVISRGTIELDAIGLNPLVFDVCEDLSAEYLDGCIGATAFRPLIARNRHDDEQQYECANGGGGNPEDPTHHEAQDCRKHDRIRRVFGCRDCACDRNSRS